MSIKTRRAYLIHCFACHDTGTTLHKISGVYICRHCKAILDSGRDLKIKGGGEIRHIPGEPGKLKYIEPENVLKVVEE